MKIVVLHKVTIILDAAIFKSVAAILSLHVFIKAYLSESKYLK
jgi:hypothetical protein